VCSGGLGLFVIRQRNKEIVSLGAYALGLQGFVPMSFFTNMTIQNSGQNLILYSND